MREVEKIKHVLGFPPKGRSRELWRAMNINQAVITYNYHGEVRITAYDKDGKRILTDGLFNFEDVLKVLTEHQQKLQELADWVKNRPQGFDKLGYVVSKNVEARERLFLKLEKFVEAFSVEKESETEKDKKLLRAFKKGSKCSLYKPLVESVKPTKKETTK